MMYIHFKNNIISSHRVLLDKSDNDNSRGMRKLAPILLVKLARKG